MLRPPARSIADGPAAPRRARSARGRVVTAVLLPAALCLPLVLTAACAGSLDNPEDFGVCNSTRVTQIFAERCATCHGPSQPEAGLDLISPRVTLRLVDVLSTNRPCMGRPRIDGQGGSYHLLLDKLRPSPGCGARMPDDGPYLSPEDTDCIGRWVADLAAGGSP